MKKYLFTLLAMLLCATFGAQAANDKNAKEQAFANQVSTFLKGEGYAPSIDSDGDVKFKYQGDTFYVTPEEYDDGFYIKLFGFMGCADTSRRGILESCNKVESGLKFLRCYVTNDGENIIYECAGYFSNLYQFKLMFPNFMDVLQKADDRLKKAYAEYERENN